MAETPEQVLLKEMKDARTALLKAIETKADVETVTALQRQVDAIDRKLAERPGGSSSHNSLQEILQKEAGLERLMQVKQGRHVFTMNVSDFERKTTIDRPAVGFPTVGVLPVDRTPGVVTEARQSLTMRNLLSARPTQLGLIDYVRVNSAQAAASMQTESSAKAENALTFTTASQKIETIASWIPASRQVLDDWSELAGAIDSGLRYSIGQREDAEILFGSGNSPDLNGLYTQATAFDTSLLSLSPGWNKSDFISCAIQQVQIAKEVQPSFVVLHPTDYWQILRTKDTNKNYTFGTYAGRIDPFWGLTPYPTTFMASGTALVGTGAREAVEIRDRQELTVEVSTEHSTYFTSNLVAIRAERRMALCVYRPGAFVKITSLTTSP